MLYKHSPRPVQPAAIRKHILVLAMIFFLLATATSCVTCGNTDSSRMEQSLRYAVLPASIMGTDASLEWLSSGISFDLEKRLERWSALHDADRLQLRKILKSSGTDDAARAVAVFGNLDAAFVISISGRCDGDKLHMDVRLWTKSGSVSQTVVVDGRLKDILSLHDTVVDRLVLLLQKAFPGLPAPIQPERLRLHPANTTESYGLMVRGKDALQSGDIKSARKYLTQAVQSDPKMWWGYYFLGAVEFHERRFNQAIEHCRKAIAIDPDLYPAIYANLSYCYTGVGDMQQARWAQAEFERRTGESLPQRPLPGGITAGAIQRPESSRLKGTSAPP